MGTKLTRSNRDRKILGVCGGIAEYLHIDSTLVRIIWAIAVCCFGSGLLLYFIAGIIMPKDFGQNYNNYDSQRYNNWNNRNEYNGWNNRNNYNNYNNYYNTPNSGTDIYDNKR